MSFDVLRFLKDYNIQHRTEGANCQEGWVNVCCPACPLTDPDTNFHGGFNIEGGYYHCWRCGSSSVGFVVSRLLGISYGKSLDIVRGYEDRRFLQVHDRNIEKKEFSLPGSDMEVRHKRYLAKRGFDPDEIIRKYGVLGTGFVGFYAHRIVIPIYYNGQIVSFQTRDITGQAEARYITCPADRELLPMKSILYNLDNCSLRKAIVVEGVFDCWRLGDNCCSVFGISYTTDQVLLLAERFDKVLIVFDNEEFAKEKAKILGNDLALLGLDVELFFPDGKDPADMNEEEINKIVSILDKM
jgi:DNA primase